MRLIFSIFLIFVCLSIFGLEVYLPNDIEIECEFNGHKHSKLYFTSDKTVYIIEKQLITKIEQSNNDITKEVLSSESDMSIDWNSYNQIIELENLDDLANFTPSYDIPIIGPKIVMNNDSLNIEYFYHQQKMISSAGKNLRKSANLTYTGIILSTIGSFIIINSDTKANVYIGSGITIVGSFFQLIAPLFIGKAGKNLEDISNVHKRKKQK